MRASSPDCRLAMRGWGTFASAEDHAYCRDAIRRGSRSFRAASLLLPPTARRASLGLYAFCRLSDDAVDDAPRGIGRHEAVDRLAARLERAAAGDPLDHPADRALADLLAAHAVPAALPAALIEGLAWDAAGRRYASLPDLRAYAARVAASVGAVMTLVMGVRDPATLARACDLGVAMQLTNIARDVGEDARAGRLYLPLDWLAEAGIDPDAFLADPRPTQAIRGVVARLLAAADPLYARSEAGIAGLPPACRPAIRAARLIYAEIGRETAENGFDSIGPRARVPGRRKAALLARALRPLANEAVAAAPALPETAFLVEAGALSAQAAPPAFAWWDVAGQAARVLDLVEALRERETLVREVAS
ncbi:phytoene/squalene synthase family protein [Methylobacterium sp. sgz302541]|uniref:phytoene/squalene synthase family protein n=1 Tax=unclassified Methylobacterium TaxID=2615210 RepID=UPI003D338608